MQLGTFNTDAAEPEIHRISEKSTGLQPCNDCLLVSLSWEDTRVHMQLRGTHIIHTKQLASVYPLMDGPIALLPRALPNQINVS